MMLEMPQLSGWQMRSMHMAHGSHGSRSVTTLTRHASVGLSMRSPTQLSMSSTATFCRCMRSTPPQHHATVQRHSSPSLVPPASRRRVLVPTSPSCLIEQRRHRALSRVESCCCNPCSPLARCVTS